jgi:L-threonylcarbamoyladenylate synthase
MPTVLDWNPAVDPSELIRTIREATAAGSAVVLPGDCGYVALLNPAAPATAARLAALGEPPAVLTWGPDDPAGLGLRLSLPIRRLFARAWPVPVVVAAPGRADWPAHWPTAVREHLARGAARFRCPEHAVFVTATPALEMPLLVVDTFVPSAEVVLDLLEDPSAVAISAGTLRVEGRPTVVTATEHGYELTESGLLSREELEKLTARIVLFVCTGNTCRSPLAEALAKQMLAERLKCAVEELPGRGIWVLSAGVSAYGDSPATPEAVAVAAELGADLSEHRSRAIDAELLSAADVVIAMTRGHAQALASRFPGTGPAPRLLCGDADLDDPIGAGIDVYRRCAATIRDQLERLLPEWTGK